MFPPTKNKSPRRKSFPRKGQKKGKKKKKKKKKSKVNGGVIRITTSASFKSLMVELVFVVTVGVPRIFTCPFLS